MERGLLLFLASTLLAAEPPSDATVQKEWKRLDGSWILIKAEMLGKTLMQKGQPRPKMTIKDGKLTTSSKAAPTDIPFDPATVKLDPKQSPKTITVPSVKSPDGELALIGIYEIKGDKLKICILGVQKAEVGKLEKLRPKVFDSKEAILLVFKRATK